MKRYWRSWPETAGVVAVIACASGAQGHAGTGAQQDSAPLPQAGAAGLNQDPTLPPAGFGSLRQDQIGISLATPNLRIRVIPLDEGVIRLLSPDAYRSLRDMRDSRSADIAAAARSAGRDSVRAFMVTFFGIMPQTRFNPDDLLIASNNATYRPIGRVTITPRFNENVLDAREQQAAIYLYEPDVVILRPFTVLYGGLQSDAWAQSLNLLNAERTRVLARARSASQP